ncbi:hypothetical protein NDU88_009691 [Pleurodeles waltl]|uniref:Uncharacterized protein n=1 Tax=Pleurodeles waltl TaxID=8319 RepID=A0AAV7PTY4_PLEWA|nr:hypothetical protein NDU88_009691 [Pleurodeles waltl]
MHDGCYCTRCTSALPALRAGSNVDVTFPLGQRTVTMCLGPSALVYEFTEAPLTQGSLEYGRELGLETEDAAPTAQFFLRWLRH